MIIKNKRCTGQVKKKEENHVNDKLNPSEEQYRERKNDNDV